MTATTLSTVHPDFESIKAQLQSILSGKDSWKDLITTSTGTTLIEFIAAAGAFSQYSIESALQETSLDTAKLDSSVYSIARMLGVRIQRKRPSSMTATLTRVGTGAALTIPAYTQFKVGNTSVFNRVSFTFNVGVGTLSATLYEGRVKTVNAKGSDSIFQNFISSDEGFTVSNEDVLVRVDGVTIPVTHEGLWHFKNKAPAVQDATTKLGALSLLFGNDFFGFKPKINSDISITYAITNGTAGESVLVNGSPVRSDIYADLAGVGTSSLTAGGDENPASTYRRISPILFASGDRSVTENEYNALALTYPGVIDCSVVGQRKLSPSRLEYMNLVRLSLLTTTPWNDAAYNAFVDWYSQKTMYAVRFYREDPVARDYVITAKIYCNNRAYDLASIQSKVQDALEVLTTPKQLFIGLNIFKSDIYSIIMAVDDAIEYVDLDSPLEDVFSNVTRPLITSGIEDVGTLGAGTYSYKVTALNALGETLPSGNQDVVITATHGVTITWDPIPNAINYKVYGRQGEYKYIDTTSLTTYTDDGSITVGADAPDLDTTGVFYPRCTAINLSSFMTSRNI